MMDLADRIRLRASAAHETRRFFSRRGVVEVQTAVIVQAGVTDVHIESIELADGRFLRSSPEYAHKKLLAAGAGDIYELGPVFRAGECGRLHKPEFLLLEWYRLGWGWSQLADEALALVRLLTPGQHWQTRYVAWQDLVAEVLPFDALEAPFEELSSALDDAPQGLERPELLDWLFASRVQPRLPDHQLTVVFDYPACHAALARLKPGNPKWAERFELFAGSIELANGYRELTDADEQRRRFELDQQRRTALGRRPMPIDDELLRALARLPECAGVAMGFDRLLMLIAGAESISNSGIE
ncbi:MAG: EF-P lysine aminoacylase EpmA [Wenzhouxiangellaceae bacterium]|nr:EF-P lysine aminoacylase EpmA [Wenzhouxiangellaceae bacterium]